MFIRSFSASIHHRLAFAALLAALAVCGPVSAAAVDLESLTLQPGYQIELYAENVTDARQLALSPSGIVFVGSRMAGKVYALIDSDKDMVVDEVIVVARGLVMPSGVAFKDGSLYVAEISRILRYDDIERRVYSPPLPVVVYDQLPPESHHGWKFIAFGPDERLYVPVGAPCNVCDPPPPYASLLSMRIDGTDLSVVARGIRNTVGFDWSPTTGELWFTDNGRDWLGDDSPPGELNRVTAAGQHFGFPYYHAGDIADEEFVGEHKATQFVAPALRLGAHVAPLGVEFYRGDAFPEDARNSLFVAEHGSWNRTQKSGYRVMQATFDENGQVLDYQPFITGWLRGQTYWGRPVDFQVLDDGSMLVSDDYAGKVYRVTYAKP